MNTKSLIRKLNPPLLFTILILFMLALHSFFPDLVNVDRYTAWFLALLFIMVILPSIKKASIAYFFSFERDLERARSAVKRLQQKDGAEDNNVKNKVQEKVKNSTDETIPCLTMGKIRQQIKKRLYDIQERWLEEGEKIHDKSAEQIARHLREKGFLSAELYEAVDKILTICEPAEYYSELTTKDMKKIISISLPVLERLHELAKFYA